PPRGPPENIMGPGVSRFGATAMFPNLSMPEMLVVLAIAVLLFGKRLPEVGRSLGKGIIEFKKGLRGVDDDLHEVSRATAGDRESPRPTASSDAIIPKFEPPTTAPVARTDVGSPEYQD